MHSSRMEKYQSKVELVAKTMKAPEWLSVGSMRQERRRHEIKS